MMSATLVIVFCEETNPMKRHHLYRLREQTKVKVAAPAYNSNYIILLTLAAASAGFFFFFGETLWRVLTGG
jgi:hypothetical protein